MKLRKGDEVEIIAGKDRGKRGKVLRVLPVTGKIVVEGVNVLKKHKKAKSGSAKGERIEMPFPIDASNAMLVCPDTGKPTRIGYVIEGGEKVRVSRRSGKAIR
ncbi:MAG: 50S ribosomal protein L24 [Candidatus Moranbacteria bacterium]|nr:50S ribosomal protein L24 [Candidatus Moranbacteria bacterium]